MNEQRDEFKENIEDNIIDSKLFMKNIDTRIKELETYIVNYKREMLRQENLYMKTLKMKHASNLMKASNKITNIEKKIESYKNLKSKYKERNDVLL